MCQLSFQLCVGIGKEIAKQKRNNQTETQATPSSVALFKEQPLMVDCHLI